MSPVVIGTTTRVPCVAVTCGIDTVTEDLDVFVVKKRGLIGL